MQFVRTYGALYLVAFGLAVAASAMTLARTPPQPLLELLIWLMTASTLALWVRSDARGRDCTPCFEFDSFIFFTWWLSLPGYLVFTRGWNGVLVVMTAFLLFLATTAAFLVGAIVLTLLAQA
ncbi:MAG: hypothetical protein RIC55_26665 [Pirellulaceae bacterium]